MSSPEDLGEETEDADFEDDPAEVVTSQGEKIAEQTWSGGSWSSVYKYKNRYFVLDEVELSEFDNARDAFQRAGIGRSTHDAISHCVLAPEYRHLLPSE